MWKVWLKGASEKELVARAKWAYDKLIDLHRWLVGFDDARALREANEDVTFVYVDDYGSRWHGMIEWNAARQEARLVNRRSEDEPVWINWTDGKSFRNEFFQDSHCDELLDDRWFKLMLEQRFIGGWCIDEVSLRMLRGEWKKDKEHLAQALLQFNTTGRANCQERWVMPFHVPEVIRLGDVQILDAMTNVDSEAWYGSENKTEE